MNLQALHDQIDALEVTDLSGLQDAQIIDRVGEVAVLISKLTTIKRSLMSELAGPVRGESYQLVESNAAQRSYNSAGLLVRFTERGWTLPDLIRTGAVKLTWQWTNLQRATREAAVDLTITHREIGDDGEIDGPLVGEVWKTKQEVKGI